MNIQIIASCDMQRGIHNVIWSVLVIMFYTGRGPRELAEPRRRRQRQDEEAAVVAPDPGAERGHRHRDRREGFHEPRVVVGQPRRQRDPQLLHAREKQPLLVVVVLLDGERYVAPEGLEVVGLPRLERCLVAALGAGGARADQRERARDVVHVAPDHVVGPDPAGELGRAPLGARRRRRGGGAAIDFRRPINRICFR